MTSQALATERAASELMRRSAGGGFNIIPSDLAELPQVVEYLYVSDGGKVRLLSEEGDVLTFDCKPGEYIWVRARKVFASGTTAFAIVGVS